jgi:hypothetical protein
MNDFRNRERHNKKYPPVPASTVVGDMPGVRIFRKLQLNGSRTGTPTRSRLAHHPPDDFNSRAKRMTVQEDTGRQRPIVIGYHPEEGYKGLAASDAAKLRLSSGKRENHYEK